MTQKQVIDKTSGCIVRTIIGDKSRNRFNTSNDPRPSRVMAPIR